MIDRPSVVAASLMAVLLVTGVAGAASIRAEFINVSPGATVTIKSSGFPSGVTVKAGTYNWKNLDTDETFWTYCIQPTKWLDRSKTDFSIQDLDQVLGSTVGGLIEELWLEKIIDNVFDPTSHGVKSAAFQLVVWELVDEDGAYDMDAGIFRATGGSSTARALARTWLADAIDAQQDARDISLFGMTAPCTQDQAVLGGQTQIIPLPPAVWGGLLLLGGGGLVRGIRRKLRRA
ncbi:MAG: hypothetical protein ACYS8K_10875 [Planctomycetota bacterium]|jgi:hypothetical protein